jgi:hypothetical protein
VYSKEVDKEAAKQHGPFYKACFHMRELADVLPRNLPADLYLPFCCGMLI